MVWTRRRWLNVAAGAALASVSARVGAAPISRGELAASWQVQTGHQVGVLSKLGKTLRIASAVDVPTRAHGLWVEHSGTLLAVARRPGDWLLRWWRDGRPLTWAWIEPDRSFNGHLVVSDDGRTLYTTETNLESGQGFIGVRDARSLEKTAEWPTYGLDPHDLLLDGRGDLMVANGGIPTRPETGRLKLDIERMDSSLARIDARDGQLQVQWRLNDRSLSLRHLAWESKGAAHGQLGVALQAEHDDASSRARAPVLALFDGSSLRAVPAPANVELGGYGGDISLAGAALAVSCPRSRCVGLWSSDATWLGRIELEEACALTGGPAGVLFVGGRTQAVASRAHVERLALPSVRLDNHWVALGRL